MVYLITGGTGLVGSFLVERLAKNSNYSDGECRVIVRSKDHKNHITSLGLSPIVADLNDPDSLKKAVEDVEVVFNLASLADDWASWPELYKVNVEGMHNLLNACLNTNTDPFLAHTSSTGVYGHYIPPTPIDENYKFNPTRIYQKSKYLQEKAIWDLSEEIGWKNFSIIRPPSVIGPRDIKTVLAIFKAVNEHKFPILRNGKMYISFIHPYDLSSALILLYEKKNTSRGEVYNLKSFECLFVDLLNYIVEKVKPVKSPKHMNYRLVYTIAILSEVYSKITGKKTTLNRYRVTKFARSRRYNDQKIKDELGFIPQKSMKSTIDESYDWLMTHNYIHL